MHKTLKVMVVAAMMTMAPMQASAGDYEVQNVMDDALYGGGIGAMIGLGLMLVSDAPTSNWDYLTQGAGYGIIVGAAYGIFRSSKALAQIEDGHIQLGMPSPEFALQETPFGLDLIVKTDLIQGSF